MICWKGVRDKQSGVLLPQAESPFRDMYLGETPATKGAIAARGSEALLSGLLSFARDEFCEICGLVVGAALRRDCFAAVESRRGSLFVCPTDRVSPPKRARAD